jgi:hypothetical protein
MAKARAEVALDAAIVQRVPPACGVEIAFEILGLARGQANFSTV